MPFSRGTFSKKSTCPFGKNMFLHLGSLGNFLRGSNIVNKECQEENPGGPKWKAMWGGGYATTQTNNTKSALDGDWFKHA